MADEVDLKEKAKQIDINDLQLSEEMVDVQGDADAFAGPPPPADGDHLVKLSLGKRGVSQGKAKDGKLFYMVDVNGKIISGDFENRILFDNVSTMVMTNTGTSRIAGVLKALGDPVNGRVGILDTTRKFVEHLTGEPQVTVQTQWTAYCGDCNDAFKANKSKGKKGGIVLRGEKRFPENGDKTHRAQVECPNCGSLLNARAEIVAYKAAPSA